MSLRDFQDFLSSLDNWTVGIVYSFQPADRPKERWYDRWHSEVMSTYGLAVQSLHAEPYYLDAELFAERAISGLLPSLKCVFNLNAGIRPISNWAFVPSICQWCKIPVLPCTADTAILSERKDLSYLVAESVNLRVPKVVSSTKATKTGKVFAKPRDLGGSVGTRFTDLSELTADSCMIYQEFVPGYDVTVPIMFDPLGKTLTALPGILYLPSNADPTMWFHSEQSKLAGKGYEKRAIHIPPEIQDVLLGACDAFGIMTYCRYDLRFAANPEEDPSEVITADRLYFIEINAMPTIRIGINFLNSLSQVPTDHSLFKVMTIIDELLSPDPDLLPAVTLIASTLYSLHCYDL